MAYSGRQISQRRQIGTFSTIDTFDGMSGSVQQGTAPPRKMDQSELAPTCLIYSNHPLAFSSIKDALCFDDRLHSSVRWYSNDPKPSNGKRIQILVIDTCSVANWARCLDKWRLEHRLAIALIASETRSNELELQMLYFGAAGILTFGEDLADHLPKP